MEYEAEMKQKVFLLFQKSPLKIMQRNQSLYSAIFGPPKPMKSLNLSYLSLRGGGMSQSAYLLHKRINRIHNLFLSVRWPLLFRQGQNLHGQHRCSGDIVYKNSAGHSSHGFLMGFSLEI